MPTLLLMTMLTALAAAGTQEPRPVQTVDHVDLGRYLGEWFEIARFPNRFQDDCRGDVVARYSRRADGGVDVLNRCRTADGTMKDAAGVARVVDNQSSAQLEVRFTSVAAPLRSSGFAVDDDAPGTKDGAADRPRRNTSSLEPLTLLISAAALVWSLM